MCLRHDCGTYVCDKAVARKEDEQSTIQHHEVLAKKMNEKDAVLSNNA